MKKPRPLLTAARSPRRRLVKIREMIEKFGLVDGVSGDLRDLVAEHWPELLEKIEPGTKH